MSNSSASMPCSISAVGTRVRPYRLKTGRPVLASRLSSTSIKSCASAQIPCSGPNSATSRIARVFSSASAAWVRSGVTAVGLAIRPTRLPRSIAGRASSSSRPVRVRVTRSLDPAQREAAVSLAVGLHFAADGATVDLSVEVERRRAHLHGEAQRASGVARVLQRQLARDLSRTGRQRAGETRRAGPQHHLYRTRALAGLL